MAGLSGGFGDLRSFEPQMTPDGRYVLFRSEANNLFAFDSNGLDDLFVRDMQAGTTRLVSADANGTANASAACSAIFCGRRFDRRSESWIASETAMLFALTPRGCPMKSG